MKKQTDPSIKAQILRSAPILLAICAIPFALAQRQNGVKQSVAWPAAEQRVSAKQLEYLIRTQQIDSQFFWTICES